jgi:hypothetical protein
MKFIDETPQTGKESFIHGRFAHVVPVIWNVVAPSDWTRTEPDSALSLHEKAGIRIATRI